MQIIIQLLDELDDLLGPVFAMATAVDYWRVVSVVTAAGAALAVNSPIVLGVGLLLAAAGDAWPSRVRRVQVEKPGFSPSR